MNDQHQNSHPATVRLEMTRTAIKLGMPAATVLFCLFDELEEESGSEVLLTNAQLSKALNYTEATISGGLQKLIESGLISRRRKGKGGPFHYRLNADATLGV